MFFLTASKSAVTGITRALATELSPHNITVNAIAPGYMATNNTQALREDQERTRPFWIVFLLVVGGYHLIWLVQLPSWPLRLQIT